MIYQGDTAPQQFHSDFFPEISNELQVEIRNLYGKQVYFLLDPTTPAWATINKDGLQILNYCDGTRNVDKISELIAETLDISVHDAKYGTVIFLTEMARSKILNFPASVQNDKNTNRNTFRNLAIEITSNCNLRCKHCFLSAGEGRKEELSFPEIKDCISKVVDSGGISISLGGGEPLLHENWLEIIEYALSNNLLVALGSNGTLIDKKIAQVLSQLPIKIQISLDGATAPTHDSIRGKGSYSLTLNGIKNLISAGKLHDLIIAYTPMKANIEEVEQFFELMIKLGITIVQFPSLTRSGRADKEWEILNPSDKQHFKFWKQINSFRQEFKGKLDIISDCFSINIHNPGQPFRCSIGNQMRLAPNGEVYPCQCFHFGDEFLLGNIRTTSFEKIANGERLQAIIEKCLTRPDAIPSCGLCRWKNFCGAGCMGNAYEATGSALSPDKCHLRMKWVEELFVNAVGCPLPEQHPVPFNQIVKSI